MKVLQRIKNDKAHAIARGWSVKLISTVVIGCMATSAGHTSDREIYQGATGGNASILMMLDNSGSMGVDSIPADYPSQEFSISVSRLTGTTYCNFLKPLKIGTESQRLYDDNGNAVAGNAGLKEYFVNYCENSSGKYYYRM